MSVEILQQIAFLITMSAATAMIVVACWVYGRYRLFGLGGLFLCSAAVVLFILSIWQVHAIGTVRSGAQGERLMARVDETLTRDRAALSQRLDQLVETLGEVQADTNGVQPELASRLADIESAVDRLAARRTVPEVWLGYGTAPDGQLNVGGPDLPLVVSLNGDGLDESRMDRIERWASGIHAVDSNVIFEVYPLLPDRVENPDEAAAMLRRLNKAANDAVNALSAAGVTSWPAHAAARSETGQPVLWIDYRPMR